MNNKVNKKYIIENMIILIWVLVCALVGLKIIDYAENPFIKDLLVKEEKTDTTKANQIMTPIEEPTPIVAPTVEPVPIPTRAPLVKPEPNPGAKPDTKIYENILVKVGTYLDYVGVYNVTSYDPYVDSDGLTYSGEYAQYNRTVAIDNIPFGTKILIGSFIYTVTDRPEVEGEVNICSNREINQDLKVYILKDQSI